MRILLIEDDTLIGDGIKAGLSKKGFSIDWFTEGKQGQAALFAAPYDAVILDLTLPGIDGLDILRHWRSQKRSEPVLILTARDAIDQRVEGLRLGRMIICANLLRWSKSPPGWKCLFAAPTGRRKACCNTAQ